jgi:hypothetical protein
MPSVAARGPDVTLFCARAFSTITVTAGSMPIRFGSSCVPPQPGTRPRNASEKATTAVVAMVRWWPVQRQLQTAAERRAVDEGEGEGRDRRVLQPAEHPVAGLGDLARVGRGGDRRDRRRGPRRRRRRTACR